MEPLVIPFGLNAIAGACPPCDIVTGRTTAIKHDPFPMASSTVSVDREQ